MRADDDVLVELAREVREDVSFAPARHEPSAHLQTDAHPVLEPCGILGRDERRGRRRDVRMRRHEGDRATAERARQQARDLATVRIDNGERRQAAVADRRIGLADLAHRALAVEGVRVHARPSRPRVPLHLQPGLVGLVADEIELLELRFETEVAERIRHRLGRPLRLLAPGRARADADRERLDQVHVGECTSILW